MLAAVRGSLEPYHCSSFWATSFKREWPSSGSPGGSQPSSLRTPATDHITAVMICNPMAFSSTFSSSFTSTYLSYRPVGTPRPYEEEASEAVQSLVVATWHKFFFWFLLIKPNFPLFFCPQDLFAQWGRCLLHARDGKTFRCR